MGAEIQRYKWKDKSLNNGATGIYNLTAAGNTEMLNWPRAPGQSDDSYSQRFYGGYNYMNSNPLTSPQQVHTVAFWLYFDTNSGDSIGETIPAYGANTSNKNSIVWSWIISNQYYGVGHGWNSGVYSTQTTREKGVWHHYIGIFHGGYIANSALTAWQDGKKKAGNSYAGAFVTASINANFRLGSDKLYNRYGMFKIWDYRFWDYELTDAECRAVYRSYFSTGQAVSQMV